MKKVALIVLGIVIAFELLNATDSNFSYTNFYVALLGIPLVNIIINAITSSSSSSKNE